MVVEHTVFKRQRARAAKLDSTNYACLEGHSYETLPAAELRIGYQAGR